MKKARVLLLTPSLKGISDGVNRIAPSLGLMLMAPQLIKSGHIVKIHDVALEGWNNKKKIQSINKDPINKVVLIGQSEEEIANVIANFSPDIICISVLYSNLIESAHTIAKIAKRTNKNINVILGGNHISNVLIDYKFAITDINSNLPKNIKDLDDENIDLALVGEGEFSVVQLVNALINKEDISKIPGLIKKIGNEKYITNPPNRIPNLKVLPRPSRHLVNMEGYFKIGAFHSAKSRSNRVLSVMCSRGCPEKCTFCTTPEMWGQNTRWRPTSHIMDEIINDVKDFKIAEIQFEDDTLTINKKNLFALCKELEKVGVPWCTPNGTKVNYHLRQQLDMYKAMANSGCYQITLACESGVQRVLDKVINKNLPLETIYPAIENAKKAGLLVHTFWIVGYPGESYEEIQETINFAMNSGADSFTFSILSPLPGTPIYRKIIKENLWWDETCSDWMHFRTSLIKVDGYKGPFEFEKFVNEANVKANLLLKEKVPDRFRYKYGSKESESDLIRQT